MVSVCVGFIGMVCVLMRFGRVWVSFVYGVCNGFSIWFSGCLECWVV